MIGQTLSHYRILEELGRGGMGVVYKAHDTKLDRLAALKVLKPELLADEEHRQRFLREAFSAAAVTHPYIASIYDAGEAGGILFIAMEFVEGHTLRALLSKGPLPIHEAQRYASEIAEGLATAHQARLVHRDLKPDNVMVAQSGHVKILDFGLAKVVEKRDDAATVSLGRVKPAEVTTQGAILGTPAYMSPEQARGEPVDSRSDIFSLGSTLYEMITGKVPFPGPTHADMLASILRDEPLSPHESNPVVSDELNRIISRCLHKRPEERYNDAREIVAALRDLQYGEPHASNPAPYQASTDIVDLGSSNILVEATARRPSNRLLVVLSSLVLVLLAIMTIRFASGRMHFLGASTPLRIGALAVLPLENLSEDPEQEYFADGVTDLLISKLAQIGTLRVTSRTSIMQYKKRALSVSEIAKELNVDAIIEGSVRRSEGQVRVTANLIDARIDKHLWTRVYVRDLEHLFLLESELAEAIVDEIRIELDPKERERLQSSKPVATAAMDAYFRALYHLDRYGEEDDAWKAIAFFKQAINIAPTYGKAYAGLALTYQSMASLFLPAEEALPKAKEAALKALEIDPTISDAHAVLASIAAEYDWDWDKAETDYKHAIELNPNNARAQMNYGLYLTCVRRYDEALLAMSRAQELDPLSYAVRIMAPWPLYFARRFDELINVNTKLAQMDSLNPGPFWTIGMAYVHKGNYGEALTSLEHAVLLDPGKSWCLAGLGYTYAVSGREKEARRIGQQLEELSAHSYVRPVDWAILYAGLGAKDKAFMWLEEGLRRHETDVVMAMSDPCFDGLRSDQRFFDLVQRLGLSRQWNIE